VKVGEFGAPAGVDVGLADLLPNRCLTQVHL
jgi:hypothetical protein